MKPRSLRTRMALAMGALVGLVAVVVTVTGRSVSLEVLEEVRAASTESSAPVDSGSDLEAVLADQLHSLGTDALWVDAQSAFEGLSPRLAALAVDTDGNLRAATPRSWLAGTTRWNGQELEFRQIRDGEDSTLLLVGGTPILAGDRRVGTLFVIEVPERPRPQVTRRWIGVALGGAALGMLGAWFLAGGLTAPLRELTAAARRLAAGDRSVQVVPRRRDEVGELATAFNELVTSLSELETARRRLVSDTAHELRTPLTRLRCQFEAAEDGLVQPDAHWFQAMATDLDDLQRLIDDLQDLALVESGQLSLDLVDRTIEELLRPLATDQGREARLVVEGPTSARVRVDSTRFRQMVRNLLDNAYRWSPPDGEILLQWRQEAISWEIAVVDQGPGLTPEQQSRVFERFYRAEPSRARNSGGAGLGLAIVRRLAEAHGGQVGVDSTPGRGCRFWIRLPRVSSTDRQR